MTRTELRADFESFMRLLNFCEEGIASLLSDYDKLVSDDRAWELLRGKVEEYINDRHYQIGEMCDAAVRAEQFAGVADFPARMIFYMCIVQYSEPLYKERGVSHEVWYDSMMDYNCKLYECHTRFGEWGTFVNWFDRWYNASRYVFGRLCFETCEAPISYKSDKIDVKQGDIVIGVHILNDHRRPLTKEECDNAYRMAADFYKPLYFSDGRPIVFFCGSWMLHPAHREILPETSNIRRFADGYEMVTFHESNEDLWRIFPGLINYNGDPNSLQGDTSLQRAYKKFMLEGGKPGEADCYKLYSE